MPDHVDRLLDAIDLDVDIEDVQLDQTQVKQLAAIKRLMYRQQEKIMATFDDIQALVTQTGADAQAAADRVIAKIGSDTADLQAQVADLQAQVQALIDGNASDITPEQLQSLADGLTAADTTIQGIAADAQPTP